MGALVLDGALPACQARTPIRPSFFCSTKPNKPKKRVLWQISWVPPFLLDPPFSTKFCPYRPGWPNNKPACTPKSGRTAQIGQKWLPSCTKLCPHHPGLPKVGSMFTPESARTAKVGQRLGQKRLSSGADSSRQNRPAPPRLAKGLAKSGCLHAKFCPYLPGLPTGCPTLHTKICPYRPGPPWLAKSGCLHAPNCARTAWFANKLTHVSRARTAQVGQKRLTALNMRLHIHRCCLNVFKRDLTQGCLNMFKRFLFKHV